MKGIVCQLLSLILVSEIFLTDAFTHHSRITHFRTSTIDPTAALQPGLLHIKLELMHLSNTKYMLVLP